MRILLDPAPADPDPTVDIAVATALLRQASEGVIGPTVRISSPPGPVAAFGRTDLRRPGFGSAAAACRALGFAPVVRGAGGRLAMYTEQTLVIDHVSPDPDPGSGMRDRFRDYGMLLGDVLGRLGIDARVGPVPGEYCPGEYSLNARGTTKLVGTAQRIVRGAWLFSAIVVVGDGPALRAAMPVAHHRLDVPMRRRSIGSVLEEAPWLDQRHVLDALLEGYRSMTDVEVASLDSSTLNRAYDLADDHRIGRTSVRPSA
ncbi:lipoate-protein ligase A [Mumia flava]|uniref:Lipoate-protein ligase A n=1 Tax=Mumia flava TaxID=1348852 RepID=A0A0B2BHQ7_9ACTN|nr:lipoate--protein ligase family protein [Mumia flava]PJJ55959.1 lipoate-protein ligase A [Mumia flava]